MTPEQMQAELDRLRGENAAMKAAADKKLTITMKVTEKGGLSLYGIQRFPVTLYRDQWERIFAASAAIQAFIGANKDKLTTKA